MVTLPKVIGMPPDTVSSYEAGVNAKMRDTMAIATIKPAVTSFVPGLSTMKLDTAKGTSEYNEILGKYGYSLANSNYVKVAFQADSFPTDTFTNSYAEGFFQNKIGSLSNTAQTMMQMTGTRSATEGIKKLGSIVTSASQNDSLKGTFAGKVLAGAGNMATNAGNFAANIDTGDKRLNSFFSAANSVAGGGRVDFPQIWTDSSFTPSYTMTVRLFNPYPKEKESTDMYIVGPIAALMLLGIPLAEDAGGSTYNRPFLHKINCPGVYFLNPCYISSITVIKGGDQQQIAFNQRLGIVDVRIDFGSLYSSMLAITEGTSNPNRPNLKSYLMNMLEEKPLEFEDHVSDYNDSYYNTAHEVTEQTNPSKAYDDQYYANPDSMKVEYKENPITADTEARESVYKMYSELVTKYGLEGMEKRGYNITKSMLDRLYADKVIT